MVFDLGIFDEAHKTVGEKGKAWSSLLFEEKLHISKRLFMTATERVFRNSPEGTASGGEADLKLSWPRRGAIGDKGPPCAGGTLVGPPTAARGRLQYSPTFSSRERPVRSRSWP